jgi:hypothetical protein
VRLTGTASNNKLFTVEVITDSGNVIVNQAHAGGTTSKSLVNETVSATVTLLSKWFNAPIGLGQGWVNVTSDRALSVGYTNPLKRGLNIVISSSEAVTFNDCVIKIDGAAVLIAGSSASGPDRGLLALPVTAESVYELTTTSGTFSIWSELR